MLQCSNWKRADRHGLSPTSAVLIWLAIRSYIRYFVSGSWRSSSHSWSIGRRETTWRVSNLSKRRKQFKFQSVPIWYNQILHMWSEDKNQHRWNLVPRNCNRRLRSPECHIYLSRCTSTLYKLWHRIASIVHHLSSKYAYRNRPDDDSFVLRGLGWYCERKQIPNRTQIWGASWFARQSGICHHHLIHMVTSSTWSTVWIKYTYTYVEMDRNK